MKGLVFLGFIVCLGLMFHESKALLQNRYTIELKMHLYLGNARHLKKKIINPDELLSN